MTERLDGPVALLRDWRADRSGQRLYLWCPGCEDVHVVCVKHPEGEAGPCWEWDGNLDAPTISPSIKVEGVQWKPEDGFYKPTHSAVAPGERICCHSFVKQGQWEFLGDCTHHLTGQTVPLPPFPEGRALAGEA